MGRGEKGGEGERKGNQVEGMRQNLDKGGGCEEENLVQIAA